MYFVKERYKQFIKLFTSTLRGTNSCGEACGRLSFLLGATGAAVAVDTACSSSLVAAHLALSSVGVDADGRSGAVRRVHRLLLTSAG